MVELLDVCVVVVLDVCVMVVLSVDGSGPVCSGQSVCYHHDGCRRGVKTQARVGERVFHCSHPLQKTQ